jgi:cytochrome c peroxidase
MQTTTHPINLYPLDDTDYNRFDSKYDLGLRGEATLSAAESRGLTIMSDPKRGNGCTATRQSAPNR